MRLSQFRCPRLLERRSTLCTQLQRASAAIYGTRASMLMWITFQTFAKSLRVP
jgi:hypothetical protein